MDLTGKLINIAYKEATNYLERKKPTKHYTNNWAKSTIGIGPTER